MPCSAASAYWPGFSDRSFCAVQRAVRIAGDDVGERAAPVDPEVPQTAHGTSLSRGVGCQAEGTSAGSNADPRS